MTGIFFRSTSIFSFLPLRAIFWIDVIGEEIQEVQVGDILVDAVADEDIVVAVVVHVEHQGAPAPVGGGYAGIIADLDEFAVAVIELKAVFHVLVIEAGVESWR